LGFAQQQTITYSVTQLRFEETQSITITVNGSSVASYMGRVTGNALYLWAWSCDINDSNILLDCPQVDLDHLTKQINLYIIQVMKQYTYSLHQQLFTTEQILEWVLVKRKNGTEIKITR
jgi:hypothetical protein